MDKRGNLRNKKGDLKLMGRNIIEIVIGIICVGLLFYAGYALFQTSFGNQRNIQATEQLSKVYESMKAMQINEEKTEHMLAPVAWHFVFIDISSNFNDDGFEKPENMFGKNCICICKDKKCSLCKQMELPVKTITEPTDIVLPVDISIKKFGEYYEIKVLE